MDVVQLVKDGQCRYEWYEIVSSHNGHKLRIKVLRDAMKFDDVPALTWNLKSIAGDDRIFDGVRLPASAHQLQEIADLLNGMLLTPKAIDMIWLQAELKINSVINVNGQIVAISNIHDVHNAIESKLGEDDRTKLVSCVGKYWCLINELTNYGKLHGDWISCNYGWFARAASGPGISPGTKCWQRPGFRHNKLHWDPSQTIRLMHRSAVLIYPSGTEENVDLHDIAADEKFAHLIHHQGVLKYFRQKGVTRLNPLTYDPAITLKPKKGFIDTILEMLQS